jgi:hypothetical protein
MEQQVKNCANISPRNCRLINVSYSNKDGEQRMKELTRHFNAILLTALLATAFTACGESPGGTGGSSGDTTPPVTFVDKATGNYVAETVITYTCTDNSSGCDITYLSAELETNDPVYMPYWRWAISGATGNSFTIKLCGATSSGNTYDYRFYSTDKAGNQESAQSRLYTIN